MADNWRQGRIMGTSTGSAIDPHAAPGRAPIALPVLASLAWIIALGVRLWAGRDLPLWIDETWTGMIASQPDWAAFWREAWFDVNPPLYYGIMAGWTRLAGLSDVALRLPSLLFVIAAAAIPLFWRGGGLRLSARLCWSTLLILWWPGFEISLDARGYALLLFLSVAQTITCASALSGPPSRATIWACIASAAILTHYFAIVPAALQGLWILTRHRAQWTQVLIRAAAPFLIPFGWLFHHAPRLADYARPDVAWYEPVTLRHVGAFVQYVMGPPGWSLVALAIALLVPMAMSRKPAAPLPSGHDDWQAVARIGVIALALLLAIGAARATLTDRYLVPVAPSVLLGLVLFVDRMEKARTGFALLILAVLTPLANPAKLRDRLVERTAYQFEDGARFLMPHAPQRLTFVWDHPAAKILDTRSLAKLGGFFFARDEVAADAHAIVLTPGEDGNQVLPRAAQGGAVIWIYNRARNSAARTHPPDAKLWPGWSCRHVHGAWVGTMACAPVAKAARQANVAP